MTRDLQSNIDSFNAALASTKNDLESSMKMLDSATQQNSITEIKSFENDLKASIDSKVSGKAIAITTKKSGGGSYSISSDVISGGGEDKKSGGGCSSSSLIRKSVTTTKSNKISPKVIRNRLISGSSKTKNKKKIQP